MYRLKIITVGKPKKNCWAESIAHYEKMLRPVLRIETVQVRVCPQAAGAERKRQESELILARIAPRDILVALHESGEHLTSLDFAAFLRTRLEAPQ